RHDIGQDLNEGFRRHYDRQPEERIVLGHTGVPKVLWDTLSWDDFVEVLRIRDIPPALFVDAALAGEHASDLAGAIGAEIEVDARVFVANEAVGLAAIVDADKRNNEFVGDVLIVGLLHPLNGIDKTSALAFPLDHRRERLEFALPALVAVHGVV